MSIIDDAIRIEKEKDKLAFMAAMILPGVCYLHGKTIDEAVIAAVSVAHAKRILVEIDK